jgi:choline dehydrogenase-like flavoprotein
MQMYVRGSRADYDGWESLGNKGWGWEGMAPYFRKHQVYDPNGDVHPDKQFMPYAAKENHHGNDGPIHTSFNDYYEVSLFRPRSPKAQLTIASLSSTISAKQHTKSAASPARSSTRGLAITWGSTQVSQQ